MYSIPLHVASRRGPGLSQNINTQVSCQTIFVSTLTVLKLHLQREGMRMTSAVALSRADFYRYVHLCVVVKNAWHQLSS